MPMGKGWKKSQKKKDHSSGRFYIFISISNELKILSVEGI